MNINNAISVFLRHCKFERSLSGYTIIAYTSDIKQFCRLIPLDHERNSVSEISRDIIRNYLEILHNKYKPRSIRRKIATLKSFFAFLEGEDLIETSPFRKMRLKIDKARFLPRIIPENSVKLILKSAYDIKGEAGKTKKNIMEVTRDIAIIELLFSTGIRVAELCSLKLKELDIQWEQVKIMGKGNRERIVPICSKETMLSLIDYINYYSKWLEPDEILFLNRDKKPISDQSVRRILKKYKIIAGISGQVTPHMFRHTIATLLLENGVDIRNIQHFLGHSSLAVTEIYTHVSQASQRERIKSKHPRSGMLTPEHIDN